RIASAVLVAPAGLKLGSKLDMIRKILLPLMAFNRKDSDKSLQRIADVMSDGRMKEQDKEIIGDIFRHVKLEQNMPKLTARKELASYKAPTIVIAGEKDVFFPEQKVRKTAHAVIPNLVTYYAHDMGHFPPEEKLPEINTAIRAFLNT